MAKITIVGCGLIGGSLARALREVDPSSELLGVDPSPRTRNAAASADVFNAVRPAIDEHLAGSDLTVLCVPMDALDDTLVQLDPHLDAQAIVTDAVGVKGPVVERGQHLLKRARFVGAHPMVGGYRGGFDQSRSDLFEEARVVICPGPADATLKVERMWRSVGARPERMKALDHDRAVATTSHLPYVVALALSELGATEPDLLRAAGPQWRDVTKRASFLPGVMADVSAANGYLPDRLRELSARLNDLAEAIEADPR
ncbi:MAG: prephenate dehydrogenase, partial [Myxococcota bacterium]